MSFKPLDEQSIFDETASLLQFENIFQGIKMGGLGSGPALKMGVGVGWLSERPPTGKTGDFGAKKNKETFFFFF